MLSQLRLLISAVVPITAFDVTDLIELVSWIQMMNHRAYRSHRKRKLAMSGWRYMYRYRVIYNKHCRI